ncbi:MAG: DNA methyltransferase [Candidatus Hodarchaeota archaeon]
MPHPRPITYKSCEVCEGIDRKGFPRPIIGSQIPRHQPGDINKIPVHSWYSFTLSYSPKFVDYVIRSKKISAEDIILDPFVGAGTTCVEAKLKGIESAGIDANDFMVFAAGVKTSWDIDLEQFKEIAMGLIQNVTPIVKSLKINSKQKVLPDFLSKNDRSQAKGLADRLELTPLLERYFSPLPARKLLVIKKAISEFESSKIRDLLFLSLASILVPCSNVRFGPGFGLIKPKADVDVLSYLKEKIERIIADLTFVQTLDHDLPVSVCLGDARKSSKALNGRFFDHVITSPPYPGDHEYTRHTRLELAFLDFVDDMESIRAIKKRMIRGSTRNVYVEDKEVEHIRKFEEITRIIDQVQLRVKETKGTSGFEKLYHRVVGEYFGGMFLSLQQIYEKLETGGTVALLVGDSHGFKMVHIETARLLKLLAEDIGFKIQDIELWQNKKSTAHSFYLPENILNLVK